MPAPGRKGWSLCLISGELKIRADVRVARGELLGLTIRRHSAADLTGFEPRIAEIEVQRGRGRASLDQLLVRIRGLRKLVFVIKFVGGLESSSWGLGVQRDRDQEELKCQNPKSEARSPGAPAALNPGLNEARAHSFNDCNSLSVISSLEQSAASSSLDRAFA